MESRKQRDRGGRGGREAAESPTESWQRPAWPSSDRASGADRRAAARSPASKEHGNSLDVILALLRARTKYDFRPHLRSVLLRRVRQRMNALGIGRLSSYVDYLTDGADELAALQKDLLIGDTGFFRDPKAFAALERRAVPELIERASRTGGGPIRVWVPACSTGEEAYSIAMVLAEGFAARALPVSMKIFATDVDASSVAVGRAGIYSAAAAAAAAAAYVPQERLRRFLVRVDGSHYQARKAVRDAIVFASQNLIDDFPLSRLDLISCRNLLHYLEPEVRRKLIEILHFAMNPGGFLLLGAAETIGDVAHLFEPVSEKWRLFRRVGPRRTANPIPLIGAEHGRERPSPAPPLPPSASLAALMEKAMLAEVLEKRVEERTAELQAREIALRDNRDRLSAVIESASDAIVTISVTGMIGSFNPAAERMFGYTAAEVIGRNIELLMPWPYREDSAAHLRRRRAARSSFPVVRRELTARRKNGSEFPVEVAVGGAGTLGIFTGLIRDLSERKHAEEREREHHIELSRVLRAATAGELASGIAHELGQPLAAIVNNIQACISRLRSGRADLDALLRPLRLASEEALRAGRIVHSMRELVEKREPRHEPLDLREPIRRACALMRGHMERHGIELRLEGLQRPAPARADAVQIEQVLINLVQNAIDSIAAAGGRNKTVTIALSRSDDGMLVVRVRDTGTGIRKPAAEHLFDPFYSTKQGGLGVGLSVSRTIVDTHGGRLELESGGSRARRGAVFRFTLPLCAERARRRSTGRRRRSAMSSRVGSSHG